MIPSARGRARGVLRRALAAMLLVAAAAALTGCATSYDKRGVTYTVRSGESIWRVARIYRTDVQTLAEYNNIMDPAQIQAGMKLYIPPAQRGGFKKLPFGQSVGAGEATAARKRKPGSDRYSKPIQVYRGRFIWPVDGKLVSLFGMRNGRRHDGIDISAPSGTPIHAAAGGKVVFAGSMRGYGNLILLRHPDDLFTAYAHNSVNKVRQGQVVKQGQLIGKVGSTGRSTGPHLHFEIRNGQTARNPLFFLPERRGASPPRDAGSPRSSSVPLQEETGEEDEELRIPSDDAEPAAQPEEGAEAAPKAATPPKPATQGKSTKITPTTTKKAVKAPAAKQTPAVKKASAVKKVPAVKKTPAAKKAPAVKKTPATKKASTTQASPAAGTSKAKLKATPATKAKTTPAKSAPKKASPHNAVP